MFIYLGEAYQGAGSSNIESGKRVNTGPWPPALGFGGQHLKTAKSNIRLSEWKSVRVSRPGGRRVTMPLPGGSGSHFLAWSSEKKRRTLQVGILGAPIQSPPVGSTRIHVRSHVKDRDQKRGEQLAVLCFERAVNQRSETETESDSGNINPAKFTGRSSG